MSYDDFAHPETGRDDGSSAESHDGAPAETDDAARERREDHGAAAEAGMR